MSIRPYLVAAVLTSLCASSSAQTADNPAGGGRLFGDGPGTSWSLDAARDVVVDEGATTEVFAGSAALGVDVVNGAAHAHIIEFIASMPATTESYIALRFAFHPGTAELLERTTSRITFQSFRDERWDIYSVTADGDSLTNLTRSPTADRGPSWSADGSRLVFHSQRTGDFNLYTSRPDGSEQTPLTNGSQVDAFPAWSPTGSLVAFHTNRNGNFDIYVVDADGGELSAVTASAATDWFPTWAPDGERLAFQSDRSGDLEIFTVDLAGGEPVQLTDDPGTDQQPAWSPRGDLIAFTSNRDGGTDIFTIPSGGGGALNLTRSKWEERAPAWSPDGSKIAFYSNRDGDEEIYVMDADGGNQLRLTTNRGEDQFPSWIPPREPEATLVDFGVEVGGRLLPLIGGGLEYGGIDLNRRQWQEVELPLSAFGSPEEIERIRFAGRVGGRFYLDEIDFIMTGVPTAVEAQERSSVAGTTLLLSNSPNPFNSQTTIPLNLPAATGVDLAVFDAMGQRLATLWRGSLSPGRHEFEWNGRSHDGSPASTGVYFYRLDLDGRQTTRKLLLLR